MLSDVSKNVWQKANPMYREKKLMVTVFLLSYCYVLLSKGKRISHLTLNDWSLRKQLILFPENLEIRGRQNELFPEGPVFKWFVVWLEILKLEIH